MLLNVDDSQVVDLLEATMTQTPEVMAQAFVKQSVLLMCC